MSFQRFWARKAKAANWKILNIGSANDPVGLGKRDQPVGLDCNVTHFDLDGWGKVLPNFIQGDAHELMLHVPPQSYQMVIMGDIHEHLSDPRLATVQAAMACSSHLIMTIFEEWRLPGPGQHVKVGQQLGDEASRALGFLDREDYQVKMFPERQGYSDDTEPHLIHINQFTDADILQIVTDVEELGFKTIVVMKVPEAMKPDGSGYWSNWLIAMRRTG